MSVVELPGDKAVAQASKINDVAPAVRTEATPGASNPGAGPDQVKAATSALEKAGTLPGLTIDFGDPQAAPAASATKATDGGKPVTAEVAATGASPTDAKDGVATGAKDGVATGAKDGVATGGKDGVATDAKDGVVAGGAEQKLNGEDKHLVDMAVGYMNSSATESTVAASAKDVGLALGAAEFRSGNLPGIDSHFAARAAAVTDELKKEGVSNDLVDRWQNAANTVEQNMGQAGIKSSTNDGPAPTAAKPAEAPAVAASEKPAVEKTATAITTAGAADAQTSGATKLTGEDQHLVDRAVGYIQASAAEKNPFTSAKEFGAAVGEVEFRSGNLEGTDPNMAARSKAVTEELQHLGVNKDVIAHWQSTTEMLAPKTAASTAVNASPDEASAAAGAETPISDHSSVNLADSSHTATSSGATETGVGDSRTADQSAVHLNGEDKHLVDMAVGYLNGAAHEKNPRARNNDMVNAFAAAEFRSGNKEGIDPNFGARAAEVTKELGALGVSKDVIDEWQAGVNSLTPYLGKH